MNFTLYFIQYNLGFRRPGSAHTHLVQFWLFPVWETIVSKGAKIRNRYNQVHHLTLDNNGKVTKSNFLVCIHEDPLPLSM